MQKTLLILTAILFSCNSTLTKDKKSNIQLTDGWYFQTDKTNGVQRHLTKAPPDQIYFLESQPFLSFADIKDIKSELITELDSVVDVDFILTKDGKTKWDKVYRDKPNHEFVFILGDSAIAFHREDKGSAKTGILTITLSYSDYIDKEIKSTLTALRQKIKK
jgi:hypothetical protein